MHTNPDVLALLALGEQTASADERDHVEHCAECRTEVAEMTAAVDLGRRVMPAYLTHPPTDVWRRVLLELEFASPLSWPAELTRPGLDGVRLESEPGTPIDRRPELVAQATLGPQTGWPLANGWASVEVDLHGTRRIEVIVNGPPITDALIEAWLVRSDESGMISLGLMSGSASTFNVPSLIDLEEFNVVDVSREPVDGHVAHSGNSILRGVLT